MTKPKTDLLPDERTVGGRAWLTNQRFIFESHPFNVQRGETVLELAEIRGARPGVTKFLGVLPTFPNAVVIEARNSDLRLTIRDRKGWVDDFERLVRK